MKVRREPLRVGCRPARPHLYAGGFGPTPEGFAGCSVEPCHQDTACNSSLPLIALDAVGAMIFSSGGGAFVCTGSVLNDQDESSFIPYFLTANHCIGTQAEASSLTVIFFYQSATCGGAAPDPTTLPQMNGSTLLATETTTDMTLLQLSGSLPDGAGLNGWTTEVPSPGETLWGVHHPGGCRKRISMGTLDSTPLDCVDRPASDYYYGRWLLGHSEGGSSGSPLYDSEFLVVGQLRGKCFTTDMDCGNSGSSWNWIYGRLDRSFPVLSPFIWESGVWVDFNYTGNETGTPARPFNTLTEGLNAADTGGHVWIKPGSSSSTPTIVQSVHLGSVGGSATIGQ